MYKDFLKTKFIKEIVAVLEDEADVSDIVIPFMIAPLAQENSIVSIIEEEMSRSDYNIYFSKNSDDFRMGYIDISFYHRDIGDIAEAEFPYFFRIGFDYIEDYQGYCECTPDMPGYREDKQCCGEDCDWDIPCVHVQQIYRPENLRWHGFQRTYWEFEDSYKDVFMKKDMLEQQMLELRAKIDELQKQLDEMRAPW